MQLTPLVYFFYHNNDRFYLGFLYRNISPFSRIFIDLKKSEETYVNFDLKKPEKQMKNAPINVGFDLNSSYTPNYFSRTLPLHQFSFKAPYY